MNRRQFERRVGVKPSPKNVAHRMGDRRIKRLPFSVAAGKWDGDEKNCKYHESFATLEEAEWAYRQVGGYSWVEIYTLKIDGECVTLD